MVYLVFALLLTCAFSWIWAKLGEGRRSISIDWRVGVGILGLACWQLASWIVEALA